MKAAHLTPITCFLFLLFIGTQIGCKSTGSSSSSKSKPASSAVTDSEKPLGYTTILQMLRKESGLRITGSDSNPKIRVTGGGSSIAGSNDPLFIVDGTPMGRSYSSVRNIDVNMVQSINVVSGARAGKYGSRGSMGVIEIRTKSK